MLPRLAGKITVEFWLVLQASGIMPDNRPDSGLTRYVGPATYTTACTPTLGYDIAEMVKAGSTLVASAAVFGISAGAVNKWFAKGKIAYDRGYGPDHLEAPYLDFYLKILQARGVSQALAQQAAYRDDPMKWLQANPETRAGWGNQGTNDDAILDVPEKVDELPAAPPRDPERLREVVRHMVEAGAARTPRPTIVESDKQTDEGVA